MALMSGVLPLQQFLVCIQTVHNSALADWEKTSFMKTTPTPEGGEPGKLK
jgi:hypothetical protein